VGTRRRLERLGERLEIAEGRDGHDPAVDTAVRLLTDDELVILRNALARGFDPQKERQDILVTPREQAAYRRFQTLNEEMSRQRR
jgi:hypothetical protein